MTIEEMHPALRTAAELLFKKSQDYGDPDPAKKLYHPFGDESYLHMLNLKFERLMSLRRKEVNGEETNFESKADTVLDMINYAAFYYCWIKDQEEK